jgi:ABC-type nitrate/sulfonate/bicarbonate transport system permease component
VNARPARLADRWLVPLAGLAAVLAAWAGGRAVGLLPRESIPTVGDTVRSLRRLVTQGVFWERLAQTGQSWLLGLAVAALIGIPLGLLIGTSTLAQRLTRVTVEALRPIPPIVVLPLAILALKGGLAFKVVLIVQGALWPLLIQTTYGVRTTDPVALDTAASFRLGALRRMFLVRLPGAAAPIATGLRLAAATAFAVSLVTEIVGGARGLGAFLVAAQTGGDSATVFALTIVAGLYGLVIALVFSAIERRVLRFAPRAA